MYTNIYIAEHYLFLDIAAISPKAKAKIKGVANGGS